MEKKFKVSQGYLHIPVKPGYDKNVFELYIEENDQETKIMDFRMPIDMESYGDYGQAFFAEIPVKELLGKCIVLKGKAPESFFEAIKMSDDVAGTDNNRPSIHFTPKTGWMNDPNGLVYQDGIYHGYFQYNPWDVNWDNMSWGHAVSKDLLHWEQCDTAMFPDGDGTIFSGSGIVNERGMMGLPKDALIYFYTAAGNTNAWSAGKEFTQKIAYSTDGGRTLHKVDEPVVDTIFYDNRDPKVFWHEESKAYIMVLWLRGAHYAIFRSNNLTDWVESQRLEFPDTWECPDLFCLKNENGEKCWFFWTADGYYFAGDFDGYTFRSYGERGKAYATKFAYAAQTFSGTEGEVISVPWLRLPNDGRNFTGALGMPVNFSYVVENGKHQLLQWPVKALFTQCVPLKAQSIIDENSKIVYNESDKQTALLVKMKFNPEYKNEYCWMVNNTRVTYSAASGMVMVEPDKFLAGYDFSEVMMVIDDKILEMYFDEGRSVAVFPLHQSEVSICMDSAQFDSVEVYTVR